MFLKPTQVISHLSIRPGLSVADFGAGRGEYSLALKDALGQEGAVYAFDVVPEVVERLHRERARRNIENLFTLCTDLNQHLPLKDRLLHCAVVVNTLYALHARDAFLEELHRVLKPNARVLMVDWASSFRNMGPRESEVITPGDAVRLFRAHGFSVGSMLPAGTHHYAFVAQKI